MLPLSRRLWSWTTPQPNGAVLRRGRGKAAGFTLEWEEANYEWLLGRPGRPRRGRLDDEAGGPAVGKLVKVTLP